MQDKNKVFDALDLLNTMNMEFEKFVGDCSHCLTYGTGKVQFSCNQVGYCPCFLTPEQKAKLEILK